MATLQDYITQVQYLVHDSSGANFTQTQLINFINQARVRVALDTHCVRQFITGLNTYAQQETYVYNGTIGGVKVTAGGTNYTAPTVTLTGGGGTGATAAAVLINGVITGINMTNWGSGYTSVPTVVIADATGTGAAGTAIYLNNILDILSITCLWGDLRVMLGWLPFTQFQAFLRAYTFVYSQPDGVWSSLPAASTVYTYPIADQAYTMEWDVIQLPTPLVNLTDVDFQIVQPWSDAVQLYAAHLCQASIQNFTQADYWYDAKGTGKYDMRVKQLPATVYSRRIFNPYQTGSARIRRMR